MASRAVANARIAYCSMEGIWSSIQSPLWPEKQTYLIGPLGDSDGGTDLGGTTTVNHTVVLDQISDDTQGVM